MAQPITATTRVLRTDIASLPCKLTQAEWEDRSALLASVVSQVGLEKSRQKQQKAEMKERLEALGAKLDLLGNIVTRHEEDRETRVEIVANYLKGVAETIRQDTFDVVSTRPLTDEERQKGLFDEDK